MSHFKFRLQRVLELRERVEQESVKKLAQARMDAQLAQEAVEALEQARKAGAEEAARAGATGVSAGELQRRAIVSAQIDDHIAVAADASHKAEKKVVDLSVELEVAHAHRRVLDKLKEKQFADWNSEQERQDRVTMDSIAIDKFVRRKQEPSS